MNEEYISVFSPKKNTSTFLLFCLFYKNVYMKLFTFTVNILKEIDKSSVKIS
jgi:hypothetical protein